MIDFLLQDVAKSVTRIAVRESRAQDLRNEILNSEKWVLGIWCIIEIFNYDLNFIPVLIIAAYLCFFEGWKPILRLIQET